MTLSLIGREGNIPSTHNETLTLVDTIFVLELEERGQGLQENADVNDTGRLVLAEFN